MSADAIVEKLELPPAPKAIGVYRPAMVVGNLVYTSGHLSLATDGSVIAGRMGADADEQTGYAAARQSGLAILATLKQELGSLSRIVRVVKLLGMVNCNSDFTAQPAVINGCSELMIEVFGAENGVGTRSAVGVAALPMGAMVEVEAVFELAGE